MMGGACSRKRDQQVNEDSGNRGIYGRYCKSGSSKWLGNSISRLAVDNKQGKTKCPSLMELCIYKTREDIDKYSSFSMLPRDISQQIFNELVYSQCLTEVSLGAFRDCALQDLDLGEYPGLEDSWMDVISSQGLSLLSVDLSGSDVTDSGLIHLKNCTNLQALNFNYCDQISDRGLEHISGLSNLATLSFRRSNQITAQGLSVLSGLVNLLKLDLERCPGIHGGLVHLKGLTKLESLNIKCCNCITDADMKPLSGLTNLETLNLDSCRINDEGLVNLTGTIVTGNVPQTHHNAQKYPPGYRFCPFDHELIHYLKLKVADQPLPDDMFKDVNLYSHNPDYFTERHEPLGEREWYFFTPRDRKYLKGSRPSRKAGYGYWKATGADKSIKLNGNTVGYKKSLVFYLGKPPKGDKTDWIMHEFRLNAPPRRRKNANDMRLDDWVLCRVYKKHKKSNKAKQDHPDLNNYSVPAVALSDENAPCVNNDNNVAEMNWEYNNSIGESNQLIINSCNDFFGSPSLDELGMHHFTDPYPTSSHIQSPFQNEFLQAPPQFTNYASLPNFSMPPQQPTTSFNYGSRTNASTIHFMSRYREKEENGLDSRTRKPQEDDTWSFGKLYKHGGLNDFSNYVDPYPSVDNFQLNNAPGSPSLPKSM